MTASDLRRAHEEVAERGFAVVPNVLDPDFVAQARAAMYRVRDAVVRDVGVARLTRAGERGTLRLLFAYEPFFYRFLAIPELLAWVDGTVGPTAILHTQNGFVLESDVSGDAPDIFQHTFHRDFPRWLNGYTASTNVMFAIDPYTASTGATMGVPGSHRWPQDVDQERARSAAVPIEADPGAMIVFDSSLWHAAGVNTSGSDRVSINHQFTRSWIKQQIDYVRAAGDAAILALPERTRQLLGWYTRVVTSLDEYYRPEEERLYRRGQG